MRRGFGIFRAILFSIITVVFLYLQLSLIGEWFFQSTYGSIVSIWLVILFTLMLVPPLFFWTSANRGETWNQVRLQIWCSWAQSYFSFLFFFTVLRDVGYLVHLPGISGSHNESTWLIFLPLIADILGRVPMWLGPSVKRVKIPLLKSGTLKIAQISDLHIGPGVRAEYVQKVINKTNTENPDVIVLTGDIVDHLDKWFADEIHLLHQLKAKHGVYFIPGNHEYYWGYHPIMKSMRRMGFHVLENSNMSFVAGEIRVAICGVTDFAAAMFDMEKPDLAKARVGTDGVDLRVLLAHQPKIADAAAEFDYDLQLSGHTHAGQFIPWSLIIRLFQKYPKGLFTIKKMRLYVNQGTGFWGPANRLGTWPEISLLEVVPR